MGGVAPSTPSRAFILGLTDELPEHVDGDRIAGGPVRPAGQGLIDDIVQEPRQPLRAGQRRVAHDPLQRPADFALAQPPLALFRTRCRWIDCHDASPSN